MVVGLMRVGGSHHLLNSPASATAGLGAAHATLPRDDIHFNCSNCYYV